MVHLGVTALDADGIAGHKLSVVLADNDQKLLQAKLQAVASSMVKMGLKTLDSDPISGTKLTAVLADDK